MIYQCWFKKKGKKRKLSRRRRSSSLLYELSTSGYSYPMHTRTTKPIYIGSGHVVVDLLHFCTNYPFRATRTRRMVSGVKIVVHFWVEGVSIIALFGRRLATMQVCTGPNNPHSPHQTKSPTPHRGPTQPVAFEQLQLTSPCHP